ncbi:MAG TPA: DUF3232 domain-containing protein [Clostridia bacterium]|nr:DUF3232 domain-containing protein [Clostridia bacterium]
MYREKVGLFLDSIADSGDEQYADAMKDLIESAAEYIKKVAVHESEKSVARLSMEGDKYGEYIQQLDGNRRTAHNKLISDVRVVNRLCKLYGISLMFEGDENNRIEIADFAQQIINEYFNTRKR